jgi:hypothetical protein
MTNIPNVLSGKAQQEVVSTIITQGTIDKIVPAWPRVDRRCSALIAADDSSLPMSVEKYTYKYYSF